MLGLHRTCYKLGKLHWTERTKQAVSDTLQVVQVKHIKGSFLQSLTLFHASSDFCHLLITFANSLEPGPVGQSVVSPIADPGIVSLIPAQPHTFM